MIFNRLLRHQHFETIITFGINIVVTLNIFQFVYFDLINHYFVFNLDFCLVVDVAFKVSFEWTTWNQAIRT